MTKLIKKMIDTKTLNSLDSISKYKTYSKYNNILDEKFKGSSLKSLIKTFKNPKQFVKVKFLEEFSEKYPYENTQYIDNNKKILNFLENLEKKTTNKTIVNETWARKSSYTKLYEPVPDPFRYNPNYNSIFKTAPSYKIPPLKLKHAKDESSTEYGQTIFEKSKNRNSKTLPARKRKKNEFSIGARDKYKNNHVYKFSDYTPRKEKKIETSDIISYIEPHDYRNFDRKKVVDFGKMEDREKKSSLINYGSLGVPPFTYYHPKYSYTEQNPAQIIFTHQNIIDANKKSHKYRIHKLWTSFKVGLPYVLVDNNKLKNSNKSKINI